MSGLELSPDQQHESSGQLEQRGFHRIKCAAHPAGKIRLTYLLYVVTSWKHIAFQTDTFPTQAQLSY